MEEELKLFETSTQFVVEEDGIKPPEGAKIYSLTETFDAHRSYSMDFPQYELRFKCYGDYGYTSHMRMYYRDMEFNVIALGYWKKFIPNLLNNLKANDYQEEMSNFIQKSSLYGKQFEENRKLLEYRYDTNYWKQEIENLNKTIISLKKENEEL